MRRRARWLKRLRDEEERLKDRDLFKTVEEVLDPTTMGHIYRLQLRGVIWELKGAISAGKEARVYWARDRGGRDLAVKIYLSFTAEFRKGIRKYILGDPRFDRIPSGNFRRLIYEWTRKEYRNLQRMRAAGVRVPEPIAFQGNVLVMEFLGEEGYRAPLLVEAVDEMTRGEVLEAWRGAAEQLRRIVCQARLVHADYSEYNLMLWRGGRVGDRRRPGRQPRAPLRRGVPGEGYP
ncbi:MAG: serine protein kinase RIO [Desulfurococcales archaeon]|nr:serine protein kinase RIO [Desulfurococcales archaeon]